MKTTVQKKMIKDYLLKMKMMTIHERLEMKSIVFEEPIICDDDESDKIKAEKLDAIDRMFDQKIRIFQEWSRKRLEQKKNNRAIDEWLVAMIQVIEQRLTDDFVIFDTIFSVSFFERFKKMYFLSVSEL